VMTGIRRYSIEPGFTDPVDRYSFAYNQTDWDNLSNGVASDFGMTVFFLVDGDLRVAAVESQSPSGLAGVRRGWKITKINGNSDITLANADFLTQNIYESATTTFTFQKPDNSTVDLTLNATTYQQNPIYLDTVYTVGAKKVGYLVFTSLLGDTTAVYNGFQDVFTNFVNQNITDLVIDLRYNGGGYVSMQQKLADYIIKSSANGNTMMTQKWNDNYSDYNETAKFVKQGSLNISNLYFLVGGNTASASELLVNNMKPYMNVKLVGRATYGKPVGFVPIPVGNYYIFPISFRSTNSNGEGNYFDGIQPDFVVTDGIDKDFGDITEARLAAALNYINTGSFGFANTGGGLTSNSTLEDPNLIKANRKLSVHEFVGSIGHKIDIRALKNKALKK
jgi:carboxyl-terminal processing protease